jgi:excinuclease ABC subunit C
MRDAAGRPLYIGKATSLRTRVASHFARPMDARIASMLPKVRRIDIEETPTAIEALVLESRLIKKHQPKYNIMEKDDRSFVHLAFTREPYPRPALIRAHELARVPKRQFLKVFGPFRSSFAVQAALDALRPAFPWTLCRPGAKRPCFYRHLKLCPGVCTGAISPGDFQKIIRQLISFLEGGRRGLVKRMGRQMNDAAKSERYEEAAALRDRLRALNRIQDIAVLKREDSRIDDFIDVFGRVEGYDISNISGTDAVGSMVVFVDGRPRKSEYRKFGIRHKKTPDDIAMLTEVLTRRFGRSSDEGGDGERWTLPNLILVDGGKGQVNAAAAVLRRFGLKIPLVGMAKGPDRKGDEIIVDRRDYELLRLTESFKPLLRQVRDEAHRFAIAFHRRRGGRRMRGL